MEKVPPKLKKDEFYSFKPFRVPKYKVQFSKANKLSDIAGYRWYTPAALYLWGRFTESTLSDIVSRMDLQIFWYRFDKPIFTGFSVEQDQSWNHALWACREDQWDKFIDLVLEIVQFDIPNRGLYHYALQQVTVPDPLNTDVQGMVTSKTPMTEIGAFAVLTNRGQYAFDSKAFSNAGSLPRMASYPPDKKHVAAADKLFAIPGIDQDRAFESYKNILNNTLDEDYLTEAQKKHNERISRNRQS